MLSASASRKTWKTIITASAQTHFCPDWERQLGALESQESAPGTEVFASHGWGICCAGNKGAFKKIETRKTTNYIFYENYFEKLVGGLVLWGS